MNSTPFWAICFGHSPLVTLDLCVLSTPSWNTHEKRKVNGQLEAVRWLKGEVGTLAPPAPPLHLVYWWLDPTSVLERRLVVATLESWNSVGSFSSLKTWWGDLFSCNSWFTCDVITAERHIDDLRCCSALACSSTRVELLSWGTMFRYFIHVVDITCQLLSHIVVLCQCSLCLVLSPLEFVLYLFNFNAIASSAK